MISTDTAAAMAKTSAGSKPKIIQTMKAKIATATTVGTNTADTRSASPWIGLEFRLTFLGAEMKAFTLEFRVTRVGPDCDRHPAHRILRGLGPLRNVGRRVTMIVFHVLPAFFCFLSA
jgi:hypothetical protein